MGQWKSHGPPELTQPLAAAVPPIFPACRGCSLTQEALNSPYTNTTLLMHAQEHLSQPRSHMGRTQTLLLCPWQRLPPLLSLSTFHLGPPLHHQARLKPPVILCARPHPSPPLRPQSPCFPWPRPHPVWTPDPHPNPSAYLWVRPTLGPTLNPLPQSC